MTASRVVQRARAVVALTLDEGTTVMPNWTRSANWTALAIGASLSLAAVECASAVDLPPAPSLPPVGTSSEDFSGWYLRGDIGAGVEAAPDLWTAGALPGLPASLVSPGAVSSFRSSTLSPSGTIDAGLGYVFNPWFRMDGTLEYRFAGRLESVFAIGDWTTPAGGDPLYAEDRLRAGVSSIVVLVNGYVNLGNYWGATPFLGAGVGVADNALTGVSDQGLAISGAGPTAPVGGVFSNASRTNFAWALTAGFDFDIAPNLKLEASYRYLNLGSIAVGGAHCASIATGCVGSVAASSRGALASNDVRIGLIWLVEAPRPAAVVARD